MTPDELDLLEQWASEVAKGSEGFSTDRYTRLTVEVGEMLARQKEKK